METTNSSLFYKLNQVAMKFVPALFDIFKGMLQKCLASIVLNILFYGQMILPGNQEKHTCLLKAHFYKQVRHFKSSK